MKSRFSQVRRPLLALAALATMMVATGIITPAHAAPLTVNNLSAQGTTGRIRIRPIAQYTSGASHLIAGDAFLRDGNPNRTVGDVPATSGDAYFTACPGGSADCLRTTASATAVGDTSLVVNEVAGFQAGDTILIGSPYCNFPALGRTCHNLATGVNEQPAGEIAYVTGGSVGVDDHGAGLLSLSTPLVNAHLAGTTVTKLPTLYQGEQFRVDISYADLLNGNANDVIVTADFLGNVAAHNPSAASRPLALSRDNANGPFATSVSATCGGATPPATCGAGFTSFYIPKNITTTATRGSTFSTDSTDDWYAVKVTAIDKVTGAVISDGYARFKLNPVSIQNLRAEHPTAPTGSSTGSATFFPTESVQINGDLRDATALNRPVEDVVVDVAVTNPGGSTSHKQVTSCTNANATGPDSCGGDAFGATVDGHGSFFRTYGGPAGIFLDATSGNPTCDKGVAGCVSGALNLLKTFDTGTYDVVASLVGFTPKVTAHRSFLVSTQIVPGM